MTFKTSGRAKALIAAGLVVTGISTLSGAPPANAGVSVGIGLGAAPMYAPPVVAAPEVPYAAPPVVVGPPAVYAHFGGGFHGPWHGRDHWHGGHFHGGHR